MVITTVNPIRKIYIDNEKERILEIVQKYQPNEFESEKPLSLSKICENILYLKGIKCFKCLTDII